MFLWEYIKHPFCIGAVAPSGRRLSRRMMEPVNFSRAEVIVEYGPGTGSFTRELLSRKRPETKLVLIERNGTFFREMYRRCHETDNTVVLHGSAEDVECLLREQGLDHADAVVSGLPFTSLSSHASFRVLAATRRLLREDGVFVAFQYSRLKEGLFARYFTIAEVMRVRHDLPPAYGYVLKKKGEVR